MSTNIGESYKDHGLKDHEWPLHLALRDLISIIIDPDNVTNTQRFCRQYIFDMASTWNRSPKCFAAFADLSQPKVDSMLVLPYTDRRPLSETVLKGSYHHQSRRSQYLEDVLESSEEVNELLSAEVMMLLCTYEETAEASRHARSAFIVFVHSAHHHANASQIVYCNTSSNRGGGDYVLTFWEFKKSEADVEVCINQAVNAGLFLVSVVLFVTRLAQYLHIVLASAANN